MKTAILIFITIACSSAAAESHWLWAMDGRWSTTKPCATSSPNRPNVAVQTVIEFIGTETVVYREGDALWLTRGGVIDRPSKTLPGGIGAWYRGARTWLVEIARGRDATYAVVTLVMEANDKRVGPPVCYERWIAKVAP